MKTKKKALFLQEKNFNGYTLNHGTTLYNHIVSWFSYKFNDFMQKEILNKRYIIKSTLHSQRYFYNQKHCYIVSGYIVPERGEFEMQLKDILQKLKGVKGSNGQYIALCPAHDDKKPSLSISEKDGKILLHCHAGCSKENIISTLGFEMKDLFTKECLPQNNINNNKTKREIVTIYDYKGLDGNIIHSTIRYNPKSFSQRRPDPNNPNNYIYKEVFKGITPILYNLQAVTKAINDKQPIFIVEGEKDCETLANLNFTATTCPMGAGKWRKEYSDMLIGATVYIIADNDNVGKSHVETVAKSLLGKAKDIFLIDLKCGTLDVQKGFDVSDFLEIVPEEQKVSAISKLMANATKYQVENSKNGKEGDLSTGKISAAEQLIKLVEGNGVTFFHSDIKELYASIPVDEHKEVQSISSNDFELWLNGLYYKNIGKPISKEAVKQVLATLSAKALYENPNPVKLSVRIAEHDNAFWYDLTNANWQAVKINAGGWVVVDNSPILFNRYRHQAQQTIPNRGGDINKIFDYVNIKENKTLFLCWLVSCFIPNIPHTANIIHGEKGAAKSTASAMLKSLIDPSALETLTLQNNQRTLAVNLQSHWLLPFDNVSFINEEVSDTLCRAITGGGIQQRKLNTNSEDVIFTFQRCIIINGINNVATRADLLDRSSLTELVRISDGERKELSEIMRNFETDKADILGGIFDVLVKAIAIYPMVKLQNLPRMADFARWGYAIGEALSGLGNQFLNEYMGNRQIQNEEAIACDPVAMLIVEFMRGKDYWSGLCAELYKKLYDIAPNHGINTNEKNYPSDAIRLAKRFKQIKSNLEAVGLQIEKIEPRKDNGQHYCLKRVNLFTVTTVIT